METAEQRLARNETLFREANERIAATADLLELQEGLPFICECERRGCSTIVSLRLEEYEHVRAHPEWFLYAPGHHEHTQGASEIVHQRPTFLVVRKLGEGATIARQTDGRDGSDGGRRSAGSH